MRCRDSTFLVDYLRGDEGATRRIDELMGATERLSSQSVAGAEVPVCAH